MATPSILIVPDRYKSGVLYSQLPETGAVDFDVTRATPAFRTNASGVSESVASGVPRLDYPAAGGCPALLVEPAATNGIRNNSMQGAVTGTPGTLPTNYEAFLRGLSQEIVATPIVNGVECLDIRLFGTANLTSAIRFLPELATQIVASSGQLWTASCYYSLISSPSAPNTQIIRIDERTSAGAFLAASSSPLSNLFNRYSHTRTLNQATTARVSMELQFEVTNGQSYDFTIRIGWPQMEQGSVATSPIRTTSAAVTRNADVISKTGVSGFIGQSVGTLYAEVDVRNFQADDRILAISNGTSDNRIALLKGANSTLRGLVTTASGSVADIATASGQTAGVYKIALAYAADDFVLYVNGSQIGTDTSGAVPACTDVYLGKIETSGTTNQLNDRIRAAAIYTTRLSNTDLAALTTL
jgi:hypothetical protein